MFQLLSAESPCGNEESLELVVVDVDGVLSLVSFDDALVNGVLSVLGTYCDQAVVAVVCVLALLVDGVVCGKAAVEGVVAVDDCEVNVLDNGVNEVCVYLDELYRYCVVGDIADLGGSASVSVDGEEACALEELQRSAFVGNVVRNCNLDGLGEARALSMV